MSSSSSTIWSNLASLIHTVETPLTLLLLIAGPSLLPRLIQAFHRRGRHRHPKENSASSPPRSRLAIGLVAAYSVVLMYQLPNPPFNVFVAFDLPIAVSADTLRQALRTTPALLATASTYDTEPQHATALIISKLAHQSNRLVYARFGHAVFAKSWAKTDEERLLVTSPPVLWKYVVQLVMMNVVMALSDRTRWRKMVSWVVGLALVAEGWVRLEWWVGVTDGNAMQLDNLLHLLRTTLHLLLPPLLLLLPPSSTPTPPLTSSIPALLTHLSTTRSLQSITTLARRSALRNPITRAKIVNRAEATEKDALAGRTSRAVQSASRGFGWMEDDESSRSDRADTEAEREAGLVPGGLRERAREDVEASWEMVTRLSDGYRQAREETVKMMRREADAEAETSGS